MRTTRVYQPATLSAGGDTTLDKSASHHLLRVLRMRTGDALVVFNGDGNHYHGVLQDEVLHGASVHIHVAQPCVNESPLRIELLQGISRGDRMDVCLQKATELGVSRVLAIDCARSQANLNMERVQKKLAHWQHIIISACEQSARCVVPELNYSAQLASAMSQCNADLKLVLAPDAQTSLKQITPARHVALLVGPEGGLSESEIEQAVQAGFSRVRLGPRTLRTETAGPACIAALQTLWGDFC
jgi:16S rRNA (uracil1498-N3)-methyltransferase